MSAPEPRLSSERRGSTASHYSDSLVFGKQTKSQGPPRAAQAQRGSEDGAKPLPLTLRRRKYPKSRGAWGIPYPMHPCHLGEGRGPFREERGFREDRPQRDERRAPARNEAPRPETPRETPCSPPSMKLRVLLTKPCRTKKKPTHNWKKPCIPAKSRQTAPFASMARSSRSAINTGGKWST